MPSTEQILSRIDAVLKENKRIEWTYVALTMLLFGTGIACLVVALSRGEFAWSTPSVITTGLLYWPLREIKDIRARNIALATAPMLITQLPKAKAAEEIRKLLQTLYGEDKGARPEDKEEITRMVMKRMTEGKMITAEEPADGHHRKPAGADTPEPPTKEAERAKA